MFSIRIEGKELYIKEGTSITMELNNSIFNTDRIEGDIIFTFDVPAEPNDVIFQHARYVYVERKKSYDAIVAVGGIAIGKGKLIIQNSKQQNYACGVVMNPYPVGFAQLLLRDNNYGQMGKLGLPDVIVRELLSSAKDWPVLKSLFPLLQQCLSPDSNVKFSMFENKEFYQDKNDSFSGFVNNYILKNNTLYAFSFINELFLNVNDRGKYTLCPQIKLMYLLHAIFDSINYKVVGDILSDDNFNRLFFQSLQSLDKTWLGSITGPNNAKANININILTSEISLKEHVPNMTNAELINAVCDLSACVYYLDSVTQTVEISYAKNLLETSYIDLSKYQIENETTIEHIDNNRATFSLDSVKAQDIGGRTILEDVPSTDYLINGKDTNLGSLNFNMYFADNSPGSLVFAVRNNAYYISEFNNDTTQWEWVRFSGNSKTRSNKPADGNHGGEIIQPNAKIPVRSTLWDNTNRTSLFFTDIPLAGISEIVNTGTSDFELILNYYVGEVNQTGSVVGLRSVLEPIGAAGQQMTLTVDGDNSLGQIYIKPYLQMLGGYEPVTEQFLFPLAIFLEVINLFKPQPGLPSSQTRWIMVHNIKMLPLQMRFEFTQGKNLVKAEIRMAKMSVTSPE